MAPSDHQRRSRFAAPSLAGLGLLAACAQDSDLQVIWPERLEVGTRIALVEDELSGRRSFLVPDDEPVLFELSERGAVFLLDYACDDPERLGFARVGQAGLEPPSSPLRAPDRLHRLERGSAAGFVEVPSEAMADALAAVLPELRPLSACRLFEPVDTGLTIPDREFSRDLTRLRDGSLLLMTSERLGAGRALAYRIWSPERVEILELAEGLPRDAAAVDGLGRLWLYGRDGALAVGDPDELASRERWSFQPPGPAAYDCAVEGGGTRSQSRLALWSETGTRADALIIDGSGVLHRFRDGVWTILHDPIAAGETQYRCNVSPAEVRWLGPGRALVLNRALGAGRWPVVRLELDDGAPPRFVDDGLPEAALAVTQLSRRLERGVFAAGVGGAVARRSEQGWARLEPQTALNREVAALVDGPDGSLVLGNTAEGLAQYWPEPPVGALACRTGVVSSYVRDLEVLGGDLIVALPVNRGASREVLAWRLRPPGLCERPPD